MQANTSGRQTGAAPQIASGASAPVPSLDALRGARNLLDFGFGPHQVSLLTTLGDWRFELQAAMEWLLSQDARTEAALRAELCRLAGEIRQRTGLDPADLGDVGRPMVIAEAAETAEETR